MNQASRARKGSLRYMFMSALTILGVMAGSLSFTPMVAHAASTDTWTGAGDGVTFSNAANWSGGVAPSAGDVLQFTYLNTATSGGVDINLNNDLGVAFGGLMVDTSGPSTGVAQYYYHLNDITLTSGATIGTYDGGRGSYGNYAFLDLYNSSTSSYSTITAQGDLNVQNNVPAVYKVAGNTLVSVANGYNPSFSPENGSQFSGNLVGDDGTQILLISSVSVASITVRNGATAGLSKISGTTVAYPITLGGGAGTGTPEITFYGDCTQPVGMTCKAYSDLSYQVTGNITLQSNALLNPGPQTTVDVTGNITSNGNQLKIDPNSTGTLNIGGQAVEVTAQTNSLDGDMPAQNEQVNNQETDILNGTRNDISVLSGGILKGTGTASYINVSKGGFIAPGNSPGKITTLDTLYLNSGSTFQAELQNKDNYDQIIVGQNYTGGGNAVSIDGAILSLSLYSGYSIKANDTFTIINNLSSTPVYGTFANLPEGQTIALDGGLFKISYVGGDGNDVVLTALTAPNAPNTSVRVLTLANPLVAAGAGVLAIGALVIAVRTRR